MPLKSVRFGIADAWELEVPETERKRMKHSARAWLYKILGSECTRRSGVNIQALNLRTAEAPVLWAQDSFSEKLQGTLVNKTRQLPYFSLLCLFFYILLFCVFMGNRFFINGKGQYFIYVHMDWGEWNSLPLQLCNISLSYLPSPAVFHKNT